MCANKGLRCLFSVTAALLVRIKDDAGQGDAFGTDLNTPVWNLVHVHVHVSANQAARQIVDFQPDALKSYFSVKSLVT